MESCGAPLSNKSKGIGRGAGRKPSAAAGNDTAEDGGAQPPMGTMGPIPAALSEVQNLYTAELLSRGQMWREEAAGAAEAPEQ